MNSTVTSKFQTTVPKAVRDKLGICVNDALEWVLEKDQVIVRPVHNHFLTFRGSIKIGPGDITQDIKSARNERLEKYR